MADWAIGNARVGEPLVLASVDAGIGLEVGVPIGWGADSGGEEGREGEEGRHGG